MSSGSSGRPKGTQNRPGHSAGGSRVGAGRKRKVRIDSSSPEPPEEAEPAVASSSTVPTEAGPGELSLSHLSDVINNLGILGPRIHISYGGPAGSQGSFWPMFQSE
jgi:hypothetical protein